MLMSQLNHLYQPLESKLFQLQAELSPLPYRLRSSWFNGHYHRNFQGQWERSVFPIPEVDILNLCDVEIHFDHICISTKLKRTEALAYSFDKLHSYTFEVYGVQDYLLDFYHEGMVLSELKQKIEASTEDEIAISFTLPFDTDIPQLIKLILMLRDEGFYY